MDGYISVRDISRRGDGTYRVSVEVGNRHGREEMEFVLLDLLFEEIGVEVGEIDGEKMGLLELFSEVTGAYGSACASLAFSPCSHKALKRKLLSKSFSGEACERAIDIIREKGYINESAIALRRAELMVEKLWGRTRIISKLREELFCESALSEVFEYLAEMDFSESCLCVIEKKYPSLPCDRKEREKMYSALARLGFSSSDIRAALKKLQEKS